MDEQNSSPGLGPEDTQRRDELVALYLKKELYWLTTGGIQIRVQEMSDTHVSNAYRYLMAQVAKGIFPNLWQILLDVITIEFNKRDIKL